jgi:ankyrin repeat protein
MRKDRAGVAALLAHPAAGAAAKMVIAGGLCDVAAEDNADGVRTWLSVGASPDEKNYEGSTALLLAAKAGASRAVAALLEAGANPDLADGANRTPLMHAAFQGHEEAVRLLLAKGADANVVASSDFTALDYALKTGQLACAKLLQEKGAKMGDIASVMSFICNDGNVEACRIALANRPKLDVPDGNGMTPLMYAAMRGNDALVSLLLEAGADPKVANGAGKTAASMAAAGGHEAIAKRLG